MSNPTCIFPEPPLCLIYVESDLYIFFIQPQCQINIKSDLYFFSQPHHIIYVKFPATTNICQIRLVLFSVNHTVKFMSKPTCISHIGITTILCQYFKSTNFYLYQLHISSAVFQMQVNLLYSIQFNSIQFNSIQFNSIQIYSPQNNIDIIQSIYKISIIIMFVEG